MAYTVFEQPTALGSAIYKDTDNSGTNKRENVASGATVVYAVRISNLLNSGDVYVKIANATSVTVGTTAPDAIFMCNGSSDIEYVFPEGLTLDTGLSFWTVTGAAASDSTDPTNDVTVTIVA